MIVLDFSKEGLPIYYDETTKEIVFKNNRVLYSHVKEAYKSSYDRVDLGKDLKMIRTDFGISFGCLELSHQQCKTIIKKL
jgi:hypothetical protein